MTLSWEEWETAFPSYEVYIWKGFAWWIWGREFRQ